MGLGLGFILLPANTYLVVTALLLASKIVFRCARSGLRLGLEPGLGIGLAFGFGSALGLGLGLGLTLRSFVLLLFHLPQLVVVKLLGLKVRARVNDAAMHRGVYSTNFICFVDGLIFEWPLIHYLCLGGGVELQRLLFKLITVSKSRSIVPWNEYGHPTTATPSTPSLTSTSIFSYMQPFC